MEVTAVSVGKAALGGALGYATSKAAEEIDLDTNEQLGWARLQFLLHVYPMDTCMTSGPIWQRH